jgi:hypothetical protein
MAPPVVLSTSSVLRQRSGGVFRNSLTAAMVFMFLIALIRVLPTCWVDAAMQRMFGLTRKQLGAS